MNRARLATGLQGVAIVERAWQQSLDYAQQRKQGTDPATGEKCAIITHPDVQRMLLTMRSLTAASRGLAYYAAGMIDQVESGKW
jgi:alkylation response protein AidB-like acyl-CoA dehydrogenase